MIQTTKQNARAAHRWFRVQNRFMELATGIGPLGIAVYVCLAWRADQDGTCYPSLSKIAADVGISRRAVIRVIKTLASTGLLQVKSRSMNGKMQSNVYILATLANGDSQSPLTGFSGDSPSLGSDSQSPAVVTDGHQSGDRMAHRTIPNEADPIEPHPLNKKRAGGEPEFPKELDTAQFRAAWNDWRGYRKARGEKFTEQTIERQLKKLARYGHDGAIASIEQSIERAWAGLFPVKESANGSHDGTGQKRNPYRYAGASV